MHVAELLVDVSHAAPHTPQLLVVVVGVSHPLESGEDVLQSANPVLQPV
jgi:hypothetical protein